MHAKFTRQKHDENEFDVMCLNVTKHTFCSTTGWYDKSYCQWAPLERNSEEFLFGPHWIGINIQMNFAKNILNKYGWQEGDGLGKDKQGIKRPIKPNLKFDQAGLGSDPSHEFNNHWWERAFNDAAKNVKVNKQHNGDVCLDLKDTENSVEISTKGYSVRKLQESGTMYGTNFLSADVAYSSFAVSECKVLTDEELFRACGGRTAHKGARHGLKLSGKLARLEQQEKELLAKMQNKQETVKSTSATDAQVSKEGIKNKTEPCDIAQKNSERKSKATEEEKSDNENAAVFRKEAKHIKRRKKSDNDVGKDETDPASNEMVEISRSKKSKSKKKRKHEK